LVTRIKVETGAMRPCFLPDGSLLIGQTGRGWGARGGRQDSLQHVIYDGKTIAADLHRITPTKEGFSIELTQPVKADVTSEQILKSFSMESWFYENTGRYGSPEHDKRKDEINSASLSEDRKTITIAIKDFSKKRSADRIHYLKFQTENLFEIEAWPTLEAYYTLRELP
jgi:hypothetical protein